jgi:hypothetical protein
VKPVETIDELARAFLMQLRRVDELTSRAHRLAQPTGMPDDAHRSSGAIPRESLLSLIDAMRGTCTVGLAFQVLLRGLSLLVDAAVRGPLREFHFPNKKHP